MANRGCDFEVSVCSSPRTRRGSTLSFPRSTRAAGSGGTLELRVWGYRFRRPICTTSETKVSFGVHPCTVRQWGHWENVILSGSLSISARSISTCVGISLSVVGHLNINCVIGTSTSHRRRRTELIRFGTSGAQREQAGQRVMSDPLVTQIEADNKRGPVVWDRSLRCYPQALRRSPWVGQSWPAQTCA